jgi:hypothetical protein
MGVRDEGREKGEEREGEGEVKRKKKKKYMRGEWQRNENKCADERRGGTKNFVLLKVLIT